jgi:uncharacterized membrane protein YjjP (DUF1212 family)
MITTEKEISEFTATDEHFADKILRLSLDVGDGMLKNGGEVSRVEDTIERICHAYGASHVEVFAITSMITAAVRMPDGSYSSQVRRVRESGTNLDMLERLNALSREVCMNKPDLEVFEEKIKKTKKRRTYPTPVLIAASAVSTASFALFFGGNFKDTLAAGVIGTIIALIETFTGSKLNSMAKTLVCSFVAALLASLSVIIGLGSNDSIIMIGAIMILVPGVAFGTAIRDLFLGELLTGALKILNACLTSFMIALGYMLAMSIVGGKGMVSALPDMVLPVTLVTALTASMSFAIIFKVNKRHLPLIAVAGVLTWLIYYLVMIADGSPFICGFISTAFAAVFAEAFARIRRTPTIMFLIPAVIPTVPGSNLYYAMRYIMEANYAEAANAALKGAQIGIGIACGMVSVSIVLRLILGIIKKIRNKKA